MTEIKTIAELMATTVIRSFQPDLVGPELI